LLESLGHEVEEIAAPWAGQSLLEVFTLVFGTPIAMGLFFGAQVTGREPAEDMVEPLSWTIWQGIRERNALDYLLARTQLGAFSRSIVAVWSDYDVVVTPALAERPVRIGEIDSCSDEPWEDFRRSGQFTPYTAIFNVTGQPAVSLPLFHGEDGLPLGVQLAGKPAGEGELLALAAQLEAARPWSGRRPERSQLQQ
jgi:amidase